jgi:ketosteroid isomerase-like protein
MSTSPKLLALALGIGVVLGIALVGFLERLERGNTPGEPAIRQVLDDQVTAWNAGNIEGFMEGYWQSEDLAFRSGDTVTRGYNATLARYKSRYQAPGTEMGQLAFTDLNIDILGREAIVTGAWHLTRKADAPHGLFTLRLRYFPEGWKIITDHTSAAEVVKKP